MAKQIKVIGNYVVVTDTILAEDINSFPINHSAYRDNAETFVILENIDTEVQTIVKADIDNGDWVDDLLAPFTRATMLTFLRDSTGFKPVGASTFEDLTDVPTYSGNGLKGLRIKASEDGLEAYVSTDLNQWLMSGVAFVDPVSGNDGSGVLGDGNLPYKTLGVAQASSDYIVCLPGNYGGVTILANNKNIHFLPGCISTGSNFTDAGNTVNVKITGYLYFAENSRGFLIFGANSKINIEIDEMYKTRKIAHVGFGSEVTLTANRILTKNTTASGHACLTGNGGKLILNVKEKLACYHWLASTQNEVAGGIYGRNEFTLNCPDVEITSVGTYGNQFKAMINHGQRSLGIYNINVGKFKNNSLTQTTAFGILESGLVVYANGGFPSVNTEFHFTGDYDTGVMFGWLDYYGIKLGTNTFTNGSLKSDTNPLSSISASAVAGVVVREIFAKNFRFEGGRTGNGFLQLGNGRYIYMVDCQFNNLNPLGIRIWNKNDLIPVAGVPDLKLYNCIGELANNGGGDFITSAGSFNFTSVNTYSNETLGPVVDGWAGYSQIVNFTIPKY